MKYVDHSESKFDDVGILEREHVYADGLVYIGKEANNIDEQALDAEKAQKFIDEDRTKEKMLALTREGTKKLGN